METLEGEVTHTIEEVTGRIGGVEETVQKLQEEENAQISNLQFSTARPCGRFTENSLKLLQR